MNCRNFINQFKKYTRAVAGRDEEYEKLVQVLTQRLTAYDKLVECIKWCEKEDEPVSGYIRMLVSGN